LDNLNWDARTPTRSNLGVGHSAKKLSQRLVANLGKIQYAELIRVLKKTQEKEKKGKNHERGEISQMVPKG